MTTMNPQMSSGHGTATDAVMPQLNPAELRRLSGERLLLLRIFGDDRTAQLIERELDRRATAHLVDRTIRQHYGSASPAVA